MNSFKNIKCGLGLHSYKSIGTQSVTNTVGGFSMTPLNREVEKCENCNKLRFIGFDISTNSHLDETLNWQPKLNRNE